MYNKVIMIGNLTRDIELKYLPSGAAIGKSAIATSHKYKDQSGQQKEEVCFLDFSVFGKAAEIMNQYVKKGSKLMLEGRLILEQWTAQDGSTRTRHTLRADEFKFLDSKNEVGQNEQQNKGYPQQQANNYNQQQVGNYAQQQGAQTRQQRQAMQPEQNIPEVDIDEDEIPF